MTKVKKTKKEKTKKVKKIKKTTSVNKAVKETVKPKVAKYFEGIGRRKTSIARGRISVQKEKTFSIKEKFEKSRFLKKRPKNEREKEVRLKTRSSCSSVAETIKIYVFKRHH